MELSRVLLKIPILFLLLVTLDLLEKLTVRLLSLFVLEELQLIVYGALRRVCRIRRRGLVLVGASLRLLSTIRDSHTYTP